MLGRIDLAHEPGCAAGRPTSHEENERGGGPSAGTGARLRLALLAEEHVSDQPAWDRTASLAGVALAGLTYLLGLVMIPGHGVAARRVIAWPALAATVGTAVAAYAAGVDASAAVFLALIAAAMAAGPVVTALGPPAIAEARRIAYEEARIKGVDVGGFPEIGDRFLEVAADAVRGYGLLFALTALALGAVAWRVRTVGGTTGTQAAAILCALLYLPLLMADSTFTPFFIGDSDENVNRAVTEGPPWCVPAVRTICACSAATLMAGIVLMIPRQAGLPRRTRASR